jgi:GGDEF domain-containing protein
VTVPSSAAQLRSRSCLEPARMGLSAMQHATTAAELRRVVESMLALPGMSWPELSRSETLMLAASEQRELARLRDLDSETGIANRRRFCRALREARASFSAPDQTIRLIIVRLPAATNVRALARAAHACGMSLRSGDLAGRLGHRRLGILLRASSHVCALSVAARLRAALVARQRPLAGPEPSVLVISRQHPDLGVGR